MDFLQRVTTSLFRSRLVRVAIIGGLGVVVQTALFELLGVYLELVRLSTATLIGGEVAVLCNFFLNNRYSFHAHINAVPPLYVRLLRFHVVVAGSLFIQWLFVFIAESVTANLLLIHTAYAMGILLGFISNYTGYRLWVWKRHESQS
ncbi:MAG: GtrA family protein [Patescibacteria group bacterium]